MDDNSKGCERNIEIVTFFYLISGNRIRAGMDEKDARKEAYAAVELRYGIGEGRLRNIMSSVGSSRNANMNRFRNKAYALIEEVQWANDSLDAMKSKNLKLIALLEECLNDK